VGYLSAPPLYVARQLQSRVREDGSAKVYSLRHTTSSCYRLSPYAYKPVRPPARGPWAWPRDTFPSLNASGHYTVYVEAAQRYLEAKESYPVGSQRWAVATAMAFEMLMQEQCAEVAKPEWWSDEGLKALSARGL
jgi:hypothetical protein